MNKLILLCAVLATMAGCTSEPSKPAEKPAPPAAEFETGRSAFQKMYVKARGWVPDVQPIRLESQLSQDARGRDGKAGVWRATFASPSKGEMKPYIWVGSNAPDAPERGINPTGGEDSYSPSNTSTRVFDIQFLKIDSDQALDEANKHGGDKLLKDPNQPVVYILEWDKADNALVWHVLYGTARSDNKLAVMVNASSGSFMKVEK